MYGRLDTLEENNNIKKIEIDIGDLERSMQLQTNSNDKWRITELQNKIDGLLESCRWQRGTDMHNRLLSFERRVFHLACKQKAISEQHQKQVMLATSLQQEVTQLRDKIVSLPANQRGSKELSIQYHQLKERVKTFSGQERDRFLSELKDLTTLHGFFGSKKMGLLSRLAA